MPLRETDPDFESELFNRAKAALNAKFGVSQYFLPLPLLLVNEHAQKPLPCHEPAEETIAISAHMSARIRAWYEQLAAVYSEGGDPPAHIAIGLRIQRQEFDSVEPEYPHRRYHSRRLQLQ
jgi:hypothetical protein